MASNSRSVLRFPTLKLNYGRDAAAARELLEGHGWRLVPPNVTDQTVRFSADGTPRGARSGSGAAANRGRG